MPNGWCGALMLTIGESRLSTFDIKLSLCELLSRSKWHRSLLYVVEVQKKEERKKKTIKKSTLRQHERVVGLVDEACWPKLNVTKPSKNPFLFQCYVKLQKMCVNIFILNLIPNFILSRHATQRNKKLLCDFDCLLLLLVKP